MKKQDESGGRGSRRPSRAEGSDTVRPAPAVPPRGLTRQGYRRLVQFATACAQLSTAHEPDEIVRLLEDTLRPLLDYDRIALALRDGDHLVVRAAAALSDRKGAGSRSGVTIPLQRGHDAAGALLVSGTFDGNGSALLEALGALIAGALLTSRSQHGLEAKITDLETRNAELEALSTADALTGISNRRAFDAALVNEWRRATRSGSTISLLLIDIDHFKDFNDGLGHVAGDECLRLVATLLASSVRRAGDFVARIGGEEFGVILPDTRIDAAERLANDLCSAVRLEAVKHPGSPISPHLTVSVGVSATQPQRGSSPAQLYAAADAALYRAKSAGRDSVSL